MKKIEKTRDDAVRLQSIKQSKINHLQHRIKAEQKGQEELQKRLDQAKEQREQKQSLKLKKAYEEMVAFEAERKKERLRKEQYKSEIDVNKKKELASNFQQAEVIRLQEKNLHQAQFFYKQLRKMQVKEEKEKRALDEQKKLESMGGRI